MSAAAPPPTPLNAATICGIAVILTSRAAGTAMTAPITIAATISRKWVRPFVAKVIPIGERHAAGADEVAVAGRSSAR